MNHLSPLQTAGLDMLATAVLVAWLFVVVHRFVDGQWRLAAWLFFGPLVVLGLLLLFCGCTGVPYTTPPADAGPADAPSCWSTCYAACPRPFKDDNAARHCVWDCNFDCYGGVPL